MSDEITHIVFAEYFYNKFLRNKGKKDFFIGTLFPDIRYLNVIEKSKTHYDKVSVPDIVHDDSFSAGLKFHSLLDKVREKFIVESDTYSLCPKTKFIKLSLKIFEGEFFYKYIENWNIYKDYFDDILPVELSYGIPKSALKKWHFILQKYLKTQPNPASITDFSKSLGFTHEEINIIINNISMIRGNKKVIKIFKKLYNEFELLI